LADPEQAAFQDLKIQPHSLEEIVPSYL